MATMNGAGSTSGVGVVIQSGADVIIQSGAEIMLDSGEGVIVESGLGVVIQSGAGVIIVPPFVSRIKTGRMLAVASASGGVSISSGTVVSATVKAVAGNSGDIYVGGSGLNRWPFSGYGLLLRPGEAYSTDINNLYTVAVVATVSGDNVTFIGVDR